MLFDVVAIDIGSKQIKFVVGKADRKKMTIKKIFCADTPADAVSNGEITDLSLMREALTVAVKNYNITGKKAIVTMQSNSFISREVTIPMLKESEVESTLRNEVEHYMPVAMDDYVISCRELERICNETTDETIADESKTQKKVNKNKKPASVKYMVGLMPKRIVESYFTLLKTAGLKPIIMNVNSVSIEKLINFGGDKYAFTSRAQEAVLIADIGNDATDMTVFEKGIPKVNRTVPIAGAELTRSLSGGLSMDMNEAEIEKIYNVDLSASVIRATGFDDKSESANDVARAVVSDWAEQFRRLIEFYMSRNRGKRVDEIYLYGGSSSLKGLDDYLSSFFGIPVKILSYPNNIVMKNTPDVTYSNYLNAIGAIIPR